MKMIASELRKSGVAESRIIYLDLDSDEYVDVETATGLRKLIEEKSTGNGLRYLFIDEIQNVDGFEKVLNGFRTKGNYSIFITGSSSYLLSGELVTKLTGRYVEFELFPLNFEEYEGMKRSLGKVINPNPLAELTSYILEGGFPRTFSSMTLLTNESMYKASSRRYLRRT